MQISGVVYPDNVSPLVELLLAEARSLAGPECVYRVEIPELRAAIVPATIGRDAIGVFLRVTPTKAGASVSLRKANHADLTRKLTLESVGAIAADIPSWFAKVRAATNLNPTPGRNPKWTRDELILALDLYFKTPPWTISGRHPDVLALSEELGILAAYSDAPDALRYRNPNGVYMKLMNLQYQDPSRDGRGLKGGGALEAEIWAEFGDRPEVLAAVAAAIRSTLTIESVAHDASDEDEGVEEAIEGRLLTRLHRFRERRGDLPFRKKRAVLKATGRLDCEGCGFNFKERYGDHAGDYVEVHHLTPLAELPERATTLRDLAVVCANCHRMIHRRKQWLTLAELRSLLSD